ncbi:rCG25674 [Rattus norvegicus]|uniref:RCG25674 n=1 Tax=Rattus norvegicus TaxID=10116 RepID=A6I1F4_RAT|nr:rCG25674 [Rattus norvegicus]
MNSPHSDLEGLPFFMIRLQLARFSYCL